MRISGIRHQGRPFLSPLTLLSPASISAAFIRPIPGSYVPEQGLALPYDETSGTQRRLASTCRPDDFQLYPDFFSLSDTRQLLAMSLAKLDGADAAVKRRKRMMRQGRTVPPVQVGSGALQDMFDQEYDFQEVRRTLAFPGSAGTSTGMALR